MQNATSTGKSQPLTFTQAALFQYVNPKSMDDGFDRALDVFATHGPCTEQHDGGRCWCLVFTTMYERVGARRRGAQSTDAQTRTRQTHQGSP